MAANTVAVIPPFPSAFTSAYSGTFIASLVEQVEQAEKIEFTRSWYADMAREAREVHDREISGRKKVGAQ